jgi:tol-pal system protein YbgF
MVNRIGNKPSFISLVQHVDENNLQSERHAFKKFSWFSTCRALTTLMAGLLVSALAHADVPVIDAYQYDANNSNKIETIETTQSTPSTATSQLSLEQRVTILERQISNQTQLNVPTQLDNLQQEIQALRGRIDVESHDLKTMQQQLQNMYQDLDNRLANKAGEGKLSSAPTTTKLDAAPIPSVPNKNVTNAPVVPNKTVTKSFNKTFDKSISAPTSNNTNLSAPIVNADTGKHFIQEQDAYLIGYNNIKNHEYNKAIIAMQNYLQNFPKGQYAANAHYWLGELYLINNDSKKAIVEFQTVINEYPNDPKIADAKLKIGFIYYDNGQTAQAKQQLLAVKKEYPGTTVAQLAASRLRDIKQ